MLALPRTFAITPILCLLLAGCLSQDQASPGIFRATPNILFILADDQSLEALHALSGTEVHTPHLDELVAQGVTFTHAYNMGGWNGAICTASRSMLNSGRSLWQVNQFRKYWQQGDSLDRTWSRIMEAHGYQTYFTGKWHVDAPAEKIFQVARHIRPGMPPDAWARENTSRKIDSVRKAGGDPASVMPVGYFRPTHAQDQSWSPTDTSKGGFWSGGTHWSEVVRQDATDYLSLSQEQAKPFFMYVAFNAPHDPRQAPQAYQDLYPLDSMRLPPNFSRGYSLRNEIGCDLGLRDEALAPFPRTPLAIKTHRKEYFALVSHMDDQIGIILDSLDQLGLRDNTYIIFTADHGLAMGQHGFLGKQNMYDHSIRVPFVIAGPGLKAGKKVEADIYLQDAMPTALELAGIPKPHYVEFHSLLGLAKGTEDQSSYSAIYGAYIHQQRMIRMKGQKLILYPNAKRIRWRKPGDDPYEMYDFLSTPTNQYQEIADLLTALQHQQQLWDDPLDLSFFYQQFGLTPL
ncbi:MAG: sulfatase-like hydrolase/transferase [Bacteroidota bacterium]